MAFPTSSIRLPAKLVLERAEAATAGEKGQGRVEALLTLLALILMAKTADHRGDGYVSIDMAAYLLLGPWEHADARPAI